MRGFGTEKEEGGAVGPSYLELVLASLEDAGGAEEHGDMCVVPARVHLPGDPALVLPLHGLLQPHHTHARHRRVVVSAK